MNVPVALPEGLKDTLSKLYEPAGPLEITSVGSLMTFLTLLVPDHLKWGTEEYPYSKPASELAKELMEKECRLFLIEYASKHYILRDIRTATLYVNGSLPWPSERNPNARKALWLREYHLKNGERKLRKYHNSMSEKLTKEETFLQAAIRALSQELHIEPLDEYLTFPHLFPMSEFPEIRQTRAEMDGKIIPSEPDIRWTGKFPGVLNRNQLEHFIWSMPPAYFNRDGYHEPGTNHYFEWIEVGQNDMTDFTQIQS